MLSVVDYAVCDQDLLSNVANFVVEDPLHLSDHSPITTWLNINKKTSYNHTILEGDTSRRLPKQFLWENDFAPKFKDTLRSPRIQTLIRIQTYTNPYTNTNKQFLWESDSTQKFKDTLRSPRVYTNTNTRLYCWRHIQRKY